MKIPKKTVDEAILILDIATSHAHARCKRKSVLQVARELNASSPARELAIKAYFAVEGRDEQARGDAAGLLRDGWCLGDKVVTLIRAAGVAQSRRECAQRDFHTSKNPK